MRWLKKIINIDIEKMPEDRKIPDTFLGFYWYYVRQIKLPLFAFLFFNFLAAIVDVFIPYCFGRIIDMMAINDTPLEIVKSNTDLIIFFICLVLIGKMFTWGFYAYFYDKVIVPTFGSKIRYQCHKHIIGQSWSFFQNDYSGRIASKVMEIGQAIRDSMMSMASSIWYILLFTFIAFITIGTFNLLLVIPLAIWFLIYVLISLHYIPKIQYFAMKGADSKSMTVGRVVDSYTNISTVKLFSRGESENDYVLDALHDNTEWYKKHHALLFRMQLLSWSNNAISLVVVTLLAIWLWMNGQITAGVVAMTLPLILQIGNMSNWMMGEVRTLFERLGVIQDGYEMMKRPVDITDIDNASKLTVKDGIVKFEDITFHYGKKDGVISNLSLNISKGQKIGLIGKSGAGKTTLVNLLLRFYDLESGKISIDGNDISQITQDSLRQNIAVVTQDTSLLHRSIKDNILYGKAGANDEQLYDAARKAGAHDFILGLEDQYGNKGYDAQVGERGVKLSGGQRQRIAIARLILKDAQILILDEATSALDSETESVIQEKLYDLMSGKTVIAIAHRLSTISQMDRLIVMDQGEIIEDGTHDQLLKKNGQYAKLWNMQSGGFLPES